VEAVYADEAFIKTLCAKPDRNAALGSELPQDNQAYIAKNQQKKGRFVYDLTKRALISAQPADAPR
jgi:hypothetical protein